MRAKLLLSFVLSAAFLASGCSTTRRPAGVGPASGRSPASSDAAHGTQLVTVTDLMNDAQFRKVVEALQLSATNRFCSCPAGGSAPGAVDQAAVRTEASSRNEAWQYWSAYGPAGPIMPGMQTRIESGWDIVTLSVSGPASDPYAAVVLRRPKK